LYSIEAGPSPRYWGRGTQITFTHAGKSVTHKALVVVSGPLRDQLRQSRQKLLDTLVAELESLRTRIGQPRLTTVKSVQRSANARLRASKVAEFVHATAYETATGHVNLVWALNTEALAQVERMALSPLYLHQDQRIAAMIFVNMVALLTYNLLQRQLQQQGLQMTTRRLIERLQHLSVIETRCWDGSSLRRLTPVDAELMGILNQVAGALDQLVQAVAGPSADPLLLDRPPTRLLSQQC